MKLTRPLLLLWLVLGLASVLPAASQADLGNGLLYIRLTEAPTEPDAIKALLAQHPQVVIDVRSLLSGADGLPGALHTALAGAQPEHALRMILINAATAPALISAVSDPALAHVITLGPKSAAVMPDIAVNTTDEKDRQAHEAIINGTALDTLLNDNREKRRFDEARLVQQSRTNGTPAVEEPPADAPEGSEEAPRPDNAATKPAEKKAEPAPLVDLVLARAVQLHRALLATQQI